MPSQVGRDSRSIRAKRQTRETSGLQVAINSRFPKSKFNGSARFLLFNAKWDSYLFRGMHAVLWSLRKAWWPLLETCCRNILGQIYSGSGALFWQRMTWGDITYFLLRTRSLFLGPRTPVVRQTGAGFSHAELSASPSPSSKSTGRFVLFRERRSFRLSVSE